MKNYTSLMVALLLGGLSMSCSKHAAGPNQALFDYLGDPVAAPANLNVAYTKPGLTSAMQAAAEAANVALTQVEIDDSEFPCVVCVVCTSKEDRTKLTEQIRKQTVYDFSGGVSSDTKMVMCLVPYSAFPSHDGLRIRHRMMLREAIFFDKSTTK